MNKHVARINSSIEPYKRQIIEHPLYNAIDDLGSLQIFMQHHVYAVWDFMSLLKALQNNLTCTTVPWFPTGKADTCFLINEIVVGEESDVDMYGNRISHFELYLQAMSQSGANVQPIHVFGKVLQETGDFNQAYLAADVPLLARDFVDFTFEIINSNKPHILAAVFTFGREDLIPSMFLAMILDLTHKLPERISIFKYYLDRHIEIDGDHHSHLALEMTANLCGDNQACWDGAEVTIVAALQKRIALWDSAFAQIQLQKTQAGQVAMTVN